MKAIAGIATLTAGLVAATATGQAAAGSPPLVPVAGACLSIDRSFGCKPVRGMENPYDLAVSPDGRSAYVPAETEPTLAVLSLSPNTGAIRQLRGRRGCLRGIRLEPPDGPFGVRYGRSCARVRGFAKTTKAVLVSPDARHVYVASAPDDPPSIGTTGVPVGRQAVAVFARRSDGSLRQLAGRAGCIANRAMDGCAIRRQLRTSGIGMSPDGTQLYFPGRTTVIVMARSPRTGALSPQTCLTTAATQHCVQLRRGLQYPSAPSWSPDGRVGYIEAARVTRSGFRSVVLTVAKDMLTGAVAPVAGRSGCRSSVSLPDCVHDPRLDEVAGAPLVTPDGRHAYTTTSPLSYNIPLAPDVPFAIVGFGREESGALTGEGAPCLSRLERNGCSVEPRVARIGGLETSPDGTRLYATRGRAIVTLRRDSATGTLAWAGTLRACPTVRPCRGRAPMYESATLVASPNGPFLYVVSNEQYRTGTVAVLAVR